MDQSWKDFILKIKLKSRFLSEVSLKQVVKLIIYLHGKRLQTTL